MVGKDKRVGSRYVAQCSRINDSRPLCLSPKHAKLTSHWFTRVTDKSMLTIKLVVEMLCPLAFLKTISNDTVASPELVGTKLIVPLPAVVLP